MGLDNIEDGDKIETTGISQFNFRGCKCELYMTGQKDRCYKTQKFEREIVRVLRIGEKRVQVEEIVPKLKENKYSEYSAEYLAKYPSIAKFKKKRLPVFYLY